ncbi:MAG TPA: class I SAM-dependent methyltransferase [Candidatus Brocadiaceae bacterium]|nr:class I SAM-dependent methyltransferase [Candidatus Brocadiaceae bacterium]
MQKNTPLHHGSTWFSKRWNVYKNLINNNYLYHYDIHSCLHKILLGFFFPKPFSLLDLGCGDASFIANTLNGTTVSRYYGIDLSGVALKEAGKNLAGSSFKSTILCGNVAESIVGLQEDFDAIVCGYSLHHLTIQEKEVVFSNCRRILREGGLLLIYDIVRKRNESRDEYLNRYWAVSERCWTHISRDKMAILKAHALESDFPEDMDYFLNQAHKYGFKRVETPYQDAHETAALMCFYG